MCGCRIQGEDSVKKKELVILSLLLIIIVAVAIYAVIENPPVPAGTWVVASEVSGSGNRETTEFNESSNWRLAWKIETETANYFIAQVYARNSSDSSGFSLVVESASESNAATGGCAVDFTGSFIIHVIAENETSWSLEIQEFVEPAR
jgi:hypothetical protein